MIRRTNLPVLKRLRLLVVVCALVAGLPAAAGAVLYLPLMWPMRDGVKLATDVYLPDGYELGDRLPTLLIRSPYDKFLLYQTGQDADDGYAVVIQDARGRGSSEGEDWVFHCDGWGAMSDGLDTVNYIRIMPWFNGEIVGEGFSGLGIMQYMLSGAASGLLSAQALGGATPSLYHWGMLQGGVLREMDITGWLSGQGSLFRLEEILDHPAYDEYWEQVDLGTRRPYLSNPAFHLGGWYDLFSEGTLSGYQIFSAAGAPQQYVVMGPWTHATFGQNEVGELIFPINARRYYSAIRQDPFDEFIARGLTGTLAGFNWPAVTYYTMGDTADPAAPGNEWRHADTWPPPGQHEVKLFPAAEATLTVDPPDGGALDYAFDPDDPLPTKCGRSMTQLSGPCDLTEYLERDDVLYFQTAPLPQPVEVTGQVLLDLQISSDRPDTDFTAFLADLYDDGRLILIADGIMRSRFRQGFDRQVALEPGRPATLTVDLWSTSHVFNTGHRIALLISSSNSPFFALNPGRAPGEEGVALVQSNSVLFGESSALRLPVIGEFPWSPADDDDDDDAADDDDSGDDDVDDDAADDDDDGGCCG